MVIKLLKSLRQVHKESLLFKCYKVESLCCYKRNMLYYLFLLQTNTPAFYCHNFKINFLVNLKGYFKHLIVTLNIVTYIHFCTTRCETFTIFSLFLHISLFFTCLNDVMTSYHAHLQWWKRSNFKPEALLKLDLSTFLLNKTYH